LLKKFQNLYSAEYPLTVVEFVVLYDASASVLWIFDLR